jgi:hypothetical protein
MECKFISRIVITLLLVGSSNLCNGQVVDSLFIKKNLNFKTNVEQCNEVLMYQFGRKIIIGNEEHKIGFAGRKVANKFNCDPLAIEAYKTYKKRSIRGAVLFWGGLATMYGILLSNISPYESEYNNNSIMIPLFLAEVSMGFGINDLIRKRKYMSKAIWHRNKYILRKNNYAQQ